VSNIECFHQPVVLGLEHGVTFAGPDEGAFTLNAAIAGAMKDASIRGNQMVLRSVLPYVSAARSMNSKGAFQEATKFLVQNMMRSMAKKLEIELLYGQTEYAVIGAVATTVITISTSEWAPGIWAGAEGMIIEIRNAAGGTSRGEFTIVSVSMDLRQLTLSADAAAAGAIATDRVFHKGAYDKEFAGIHKIIQNTGSLFGISAASYSLWKGNEYTISPSGSLSFNVLQDALTRAVEKGLEEDVVVFVNPRSWSDLLNEQAALRRYDSGYKVDKAENGSGALIFHSQAGKMEIHPSIYCKEGHAYVLCIDELQRIGSTDITFRRPGQGEEFFKDLENAAGYELRAYTDQALFSSAPGKLVLISGIVN
jgi:hypothetical protein